MLTVARLAGGSRIIGSYADFAGSRSNGTRSGPGRNHLARGGFRHYYSTHHETKAPQKTFGPPEGNDAPLRGLGDRAAGGGSGVGGKFSK